jgi:hypothetical protein
MIQKKSCPIGKLTENNMGKAKSSTVLQIFQ